MLEKVKEIFRNYEPKKATVRLGTLIIVGLIEIIYSGNISVALESIWLVGIVIYGIKIFFDLKLEYRPNYHRGYWSDGSAEYDVLGWGFMLGVRAVIAAVCGTFLMAVELIQTIIFYVKSIINKNVEARV